MKILLFDLDDTLLRIDREGYHRDYYRKVGRWFRRLVPPDIFVESLIEATRVMIRNRDPQVTNREVFERSFFPRIRRDPEEILPLFDRFYQEEFPSLSVHSLPVEAAREAIVCAKERGLEVAIATNPVYPKVAITERMRWAGIADLEFRLVTSYEEMHFCKPHTEYYVEILQKIGSSPHECMMVGNDGIDDLSAGLVGITTFLVEDRAINVEFAPTKPDMVGSLRDVIRFLRRGGPWPSGKPGPGT